MLAFDLAHPMTPSADRAGLAPASRRRALASALGALALLAAACSQPPPAAPAAAPPRANAAASAGAAASTSAAAPAPACPLAARGADGLTPLERGLRAALVEARFDQVMDFGPEAEDVCPKEGPCPSTPLARLPSVDLAVIAFPEGCPPAGASVVLSADLPEGRVNAIDPVTLQVTGVRFRRWDINRWNRGAGASDGARSRAPEPPLTAADDLVPGQTGVDFLVPYPASNFKLLVAVQALRLVDQGALALDGQVFYEGAGRPLRAWLDDMITRSDNVSARAIIRKLHQLGAMEPLSGVFAGLGLPTLQIHGTSPEDGGTWKPGQIHMGAWDTARLLWLLDPDAPRPAWRAPGGPVDAGFLGAGSRALLLGLLREQAFHDVLSTGALCGAPGVAPGIPALMPARWIGADGTVTLDELRRPRDARPCNAAAEVLFAHKTGQTLNYGSDAGIVTGLPGRARRHYIVALFTNLGYRYADRERTGGPLPCLAEGVCYTQRIPALGARIDALLRGFLEQEAHGAQREQGG